MRFNPGIGVVPIREPLGFRYEEGVLDHHPNVARSTQFGLVCGILPAMVPIPSMPSQWT